MRAYSVEAIAAMRETHGRPMVYIAAYLDAGTKRVCLAAHDLEYPSGTVWRGLDGILSVGTVEDSGDLSASGFSYVIHAQNTAELSEFLLQPLAGRAVDVFFAMLDENYNPIGAPVLLHRGRISARVERDDGTNSLITVTTESPLATAQRPTAFRFNLAGHQVFYPDDKYFSHIATTTEKETGWGRGL